jgi:hypothetical protein
MENKKTTNTECQSCKKGLNGKQYTLITFSFYILGSSIYGTIKLIEYIVTLF